jgi:HK97 family phage prohead protease
MLAPGAFRAALRSQPDVRLLRNHDPNYVMARTASGTLELREDGTGLHVFARVDRRIGWVEDLRTSMQRGDVDQMSFAFSINDNGDEWAATEDGQVVRTILPDGIRDLFDVSIVTYPAYEATRVNMRSDLEAAAAAGKLPAESLQHVGLAYSVEPVTVGGPNIAPSQAGVPAESRQGSAFVARVASVRLRARKTPSLTEDN